MGLRAQYDYKGARVIDPQRGALAAQEKTGGNIATGAAFFEWHFRPWICDFRATASWISAQDANALTVSRVAGSSNSYSESLGLQYFFNVSTMLRLEGTATESPQMALASGLSQNSFVTYTGALSFRNEF